MYQCTAECITIRYEAKEDKNELSNTCDWNIKQNSYVQMETGRATRGPNAPGSRLRLKPVGRTGRNGHKNFYLLIFSFKSRTFSQVGFKKVKFGKYIGSIGTMSIANGNENHVLSYVINE